MAIGRSLLACGRDSFLWWHANFLSSPLTLPPSYLLDYLS